MPVQQHPIPQNVTQFQFRLVGDMTLKQFLELAAGIVVGLIFYAAPLPFFFKWPLVIIAVATGASMAFLPIEGRPLEQWILAFIRSIYAPTVYTWQKEGATPPQPISPPTPSTPSPQPVIAPITTQSVTQSIQPSPQSTVAQPIQIQTTPQVTQVTPVSTFSQTPEPSAPPLTPAPVYSHQPKPVFTAPSQPIHIEKQVTPPP